MKKSVLIRNLNAFAVHRLTILGALVILLLGLVPMAGAANWAQTYYNGAHTGYNSTEKTLGVSNVPSLQLLWAAGVAGGVTNLAVDEDVVYATGQANDLVALNATTGVQLWSANTGGNTGTNAIATGGGLVFVQCDLTDQGGTPYGAICAYKAKTGKLVWQISDPCNCLPESRVSGPLVYAGGVVYFGYSYGGTTAITGIYAVQASSGEQLWGALEEFNNGWSVSGAAVAGSEVYVDANNYSSGQIYALAASTGDQTWTTPVNGGANTSISVSGGVVYASTEWTGTNATVYAVKATTGATLWSYAYGTENWCGGAEAPSPPAIAKGVVYFQGVDGNLYALKAKNGSLMWVETPNEGECDHYTSSPSIANGVVYINGGDNAGFDANTTAYNATTGALLWSSPSPHGTLEMPPVVANGILYFASPGDNICESICAYSVLGDVKKE
jgi:outer membrane protein assembly factor BamB